MINPPVAVPCCAIAVQKAINTDMQTNYPATDINNNLFKPNTLPRPALHTALTRKHNVVTTHHDGKVNWKDFAFTGSLKNIKQYAHLSFNNDNKDQELAFTQIVTAFVLQLHQKSNFVIGVRNKESIHEINILKSMLNNPSQFICFLSGQGGSGKSRVIGAVLHYCKFFCQELNLEFSRQTIIVTALTGAAAVNINGQTTSKACKLNCKNIEKCDKWAHETCMVIVDEVSFCSQEELTSLNANLSVLCD